MDHFIRAKKKQTLPPELGRSRDNSISNDLTTTISQASKTFDLGNMFEIFPKIYQAFYYRPKKKIRKKYTTDFTLATIKALNLLFKFVNGNLKPDWITLFTQYTSSKNPLKPFSADSIEKFLVITYEYLFLIQNSIYRNQSPPDTFTISLLKHFQYRIVDSMNVIIGLKASKEVVESSLQFCKYKLQLPIAIQTDNNIIITKNQVAPDQRTNVSDLLQAIVNWSIIDDPVVVQERVRQVAGEIRGMKEIEKGSLILSETEKGIFKYVRYTGEKAGNILTVAISACETKTIEVNIENVYYISDVMLERIRSYDLQDLEKKIISIPTNTMYQDTMQRVSQKLIPIFEELNINFPLIKRAETHLDDLSLLELHKLSIMHEQLVYLKNNIPHDVVDELQSEASETLSKILNDRLAHLYFRPTYKNVLAEFQHFYVKDLLTMVLGRYIGVCYTGFDNFEMRKWEMQKGIRKDKMVSMWLNDIDNAVNEFLTKQGYIHDAVPDNYTEDPPDDLDLVYKNEILLDELLSPAKAEKLAAFIDEVKLKIYPKIDLFIDDGQFLLCKHFGMDLDEFSLSQAIDAFSALSPNNSIEWIDVIIKDLIYLNEMKELENVGHSKDKFHVVPITGLVMGSIYRAQNECKTVSEYWERNESSKNKETDIHKAVMAFDLPRVQEILSREPYLVNAMDNLRCTPLLLACHNLSNNSYLICKELLQSNRINVNIQNTAGSTAIQVLCKSPPPETKERTEEVEEILKLLINKGAQINRLSKKKESLLRLCTINDNLFVCRILLQTNIHVDMEDFALHAIKNHAHDIISNVIAELPELIPLEVALNEHHFCCAKLLKEKKIDSRYKHSGTLRKTQSLLIH